MIQENPNVENLIVNSQKNIEIIKTHNFSHQKKKFAKIDLNLKHI